MSITSKTHCETTNEKVRSESERARRDIALIGFFIWVGRDVIALVKQ